MRVHIVAPWPDDDDLSEALRRLTQAIDVVGAADGKAGGLFGGSWGYGANYENDVFLMHRYCWCEGVECPWCGGCQCPESAFHYFVDGVEVSYERWTQFYDEYVYGHGKTFLSDVGRRDKQQRADIDRRSKEAHKRRQSRHDPECDYCLRRGIWSAYAIPDGRSGAPHLWHKSSGAQVRWYKYIGRGMEVNPPTTGTWADVFRECHESLQAVAAVAKADA